MRENQEVFDLLNQVDGLVVQYGLDLVGELVLLIGGWIWPAGPDAACYACWTARRASKRP